MNLDALYSKLLVKTNAKLVLVVLDGLGDIATLAQGESTPLEAALTPNLDLLVAEGCAQGRMIPVAPGITPGSGPGHLGLFGYDPLEFEVGRGVIEALGLGLELKPGDICARANFCTLNPKGIVTDRRAGRIATEVCEGLCALLQKNVRILGDTEVIIRAGKEHRFVVIFRGKGLEGPLTDSDPNPLSGRRTRSPRNRKRLRSSSRNSTRRRCRCWPRRNRPTAFSCAASRISRRFNHSKIATACAPRPSRCTRCTRGWRNWLE